MLGNKISVAHLAEHARSFNPGEIFTRSLSDLKGSEIVFGKEVERLSPLLGWTSDGVDSTAEPIPLPEDSTARLLVGVDSSSALIGRTRRGLLGVVRGAAAHAWQRARIGTIRYGPYFVHLDSAFLGLVSESDGVHNGALALADSSLLLQLLRRTLEAALWLAHSGGGDHLVLVDGAPPRALVGDSMEGMLRMGHREGLICFSKQTALPEVQLAASTLARSAQAPAFLPLSHVSSARGRALWQVGVVRFRAPGLVLRADAPNLDRERVPIILAQVSWNDLFTNGYPETLRMAHHACRFTEFEIEAMRIHAARCFALRPVPSLDARLVALGWW